jgi:glycerate kinase
MKIVIAPDSFKESLTAKQAAAAIATGLRRALPKAECVQVPLADGELHLRAAAHGWSGELVQNGRARAVTVAHAQAAAAPDGMRPAAASAARSAAA